MSELISQGGYGSYVWSAYGLTLVLLVAEILQLRHQRRTIFLRLGRLMRMRGRERHKRETT